MTDQEESVDFVTEGPNLDSLSPMIGENNRDGALQVRPYVRLNFQWTAFNLVVFGVAAHSTALGLSLLFFPAWSLKFVGWNYTGSFFWPSQAGLFLVILGVTYALAIRLRSLIWLTIGSKASAVVFLFMSVASLEAPPIVPLLAIGDGLMGLAVALVYWELRRAEISESKQWSQIRTL